MSMSFDLTWNLLLFSIKSLLLWTNFFILIFIMIIFELLFMSVIPIYSGLNLAILLLTLIISGIVFSHIYNLKKSTLYNNIELNQHSVIFFYLNIFVIMVLFSFIFNLIFLGIT